MIREKKKFVIKSLQGNNVDDENKREQIKDQRSHLLIMEMTTTGILSTSSPLNQAELSVRRNLMQNPNQRRDQVLYGVSKEHLGRKQLIMKKRPATQLRPIQGNLRPIQVWRLESFRSSPGKNGVWFLHKQQVPRACQEHPRLQQSRSSQRESLKPENECVGFD